MDGAIVHKGYLVANVPIGFSQLLLIFGGTAGTVSGPPSIFLGKFPNACNCGHLSPADFVQHGVLHRKGLKSRIIGKERMPENQLLDREKFGGQLRTDFVNSAVGKDSAKRCSWLMEQLLYRGLLFGVPTSDMIAAKY